MESISGNILGEEENNNISQKKYFCCDGKIKEQSEEVKNKNRSCGLYSTTPTTY